MKIIDFKDFYVNTPNNRLRIGPYRGGNWLANTILYDNEPYVSYGNICPTCLFRFKKIRNSIDVDLIEISELIEKLNSGTIGFNDYSLNLLSKILPNGRYTALYATIKPMLRYDDSTQYDESSNFNFYLGSQNDEGTEFGYFHEKLKNIPGLHKKINEQFYNLFIPQQDISLLSESRLNFYREAYKSNIQPTAFSLGFLSSKQSFLISRLKDANKSNFRSTVQVVLTNLILDGHHKIYAASQLEKELNIICFLRNSKQRNDDIRFKEYLEKIVKNPDHDLLESIYEYPSNDWILSRYDDGL